MESKSTIEFDSPWKKVLELHFEDCIKFFFPQAHADIDWKHGFEFLDKEFQKAVRNAVVGTRLADKLVKVWTKENTEAWVLIHIEVQSQVEKTFAEDMFTYYYRIYDRYKNKIASLAILGDENRSWRPTGFNSELWNCRLSFSFPVIKLTDYKRQSSTLEDSNNPFAIVVMAHLAAQETRKDPSSRLASKLAIIRRLYDRGYKKESVVNLLRFIDWLMILPTELESQLEQEMKNYKEGLPMEYVTSWERSGIRKGIVQGQDKMRKPLIESLKLNLEFKFGKKGLDLLPVISQLESAEELSTFQEKLKAAHTVSELKKLCKSLY
jgi:hypothetical protein